MENEQFFTSPFKCIYTRILKYSNDTKNAVHFFHYFVNEEIFCFHRPLKNCKKW